MDLLTVLMHELGHILGFDHEEEGVMAETLATGTRRSPTADLQTGDPVLLDQLFAVRPSLDEQEAAGGDLVSALLSLKEEWTASRKG
jgi:hypothetical protein